MLIWEGIHVGEKSDKYNILNREDSGLIGIKLRFDNKYNNIIIIIIYVILL